MITNLRQNITGLEEILTAVNELPEGSIDPILQEKTVSPSTSTQTIMPDSGYDGLSKVTVDAMATATQATPTISVSSDGLITASATQAAGYVASGTKSATKQLTTQAAKTVTPTTSDQTAVASGRYTTGAVTVKGDANLVAENIAEGVSIFGVTGTHSGGSDGGVETCSVEINMMAGVGTSVFYNRLNESGVIQLTQTTLTGSLMVGQCNLDNVVCESSITILANLDSCTIDGTAVSSYSDTNITIIKAPSVSGENCYIDNM